MSTLAPRVSNFGGSAELVDQQLAQLGLISTRVAYRRARCTYRQIDYWVRTGVLESPLGSGTGSGSVRGLTLREVEVAAAIATLSPAGRSAPGMRLDHPLAQKVIAHVRKHGLIGLVESGPLIFDAGRVTLED